MSSEDAGMSIERGQDLMDSRRSFLGKLMIGIPALAGLPLLGGIATRSSEAGFVEGGEREDSEATPPPWGLLAPLSEGDRVGSGWCVAGLSGVERGAAVLSLSHRSGSGERVHLCRNDGQPRGAASTAAVDLVLMNGGAGELGTDEGLGLVLSEVAGVIAGNEGRPENRRHIRAMVPHDERLRRYGKEQTECLR